MASQDVGSIGFGQFDGIGFPLDWFWHIERTSVALSWCWRVLMVRNSRAELVRGGDSGEDGNEMCFLL